MSNHRLRVSRTIECELQRIVGKPLRRGLSRRRLKVERAVRQANCWLFVAGVNAWFGTEFADTSSSSVTTEKFAS